MFLLRGNKLRKILGWILPIHFGGRSSSIGIDLILAVLGGIVVFQDIQPAFELASTCYLLRCLVEMSVFISQSTHKQHFGKLCQWEQVPEIWNEICSVEHKYPSRKLCWERKLSISGGSHHLPLEKESIIGITFSLSIMYKLSVQFQWDVSFHFLAVVFQLILLEWWFAGGGWGSLVMLLLCLSN